MKLLTLYHNGNTIEVHNTMSGKEKIYYNEEEVSEKWSMFGALHSFSVTEDGEEVDYKVTTALHINGIGCDIWRAGEPLLTFS